MRFLRSFFNRLRWRQLPDRSVVVPAFGRRRFEVLPRLRVYRRVRHDPPILVADLEFQRLWVVIRVHQPRRTVADEFLLNTGGSRDPHSTFSPCFISTAPTATGC